MGKDLRAASAARYADGESTAASFKEGEFFAIATPPYGYEDEFELFIAVLGPDGCFVDTLRADTEINGIKFKKGRMIVYCHDLNRIADDPDRRTFVLEPTLRAVEARMVRPTGVDVETGRDAPRPVGAPLAVPKALEAYAHHVLALSDRQKSKIITECDG